MTGFEDKDAADAVALFAGNGEVDAMLDEVCRVTGMGFAAVARVTEDRWIACQVVDKIAFGLEPGDELAIKTTICNDIRQSGAHVVIDHVGTDPDWRTHPTPMLYGFESYISLPIRLADGRFFGTLCAIDPEPREISTPLVVGLMERLAVRIGAVLDRSQA